jgi:hypothetical protein
MKMFHKVKQVTPLSGYRLSVEFVNGAVKEYDVQALFDQWEAFKALSYIPGLFNLVKVEAGGYGISWNDYIDLACDELFENGV